MTATARKIAVLFYNAMRFGMEYKDPGADHDEQQYRDRVLKQLHRRAAQFGLILQPQQYPLWRCFLGKRRRTSQGHAVKYAWMEGQRKVYTLDELCAVLAVSERGYRAWKHGGPSDRTRLTDAQMLALIRAIHAALKGAYGSPRMVRELRGRGFPVSKERVERLMREHGIRARHTRRYKVTTDSTHHLPVAANLLNRNFTPSVSIITRI